MKHEIPTEAQLRAKPLEQFVVGNEVIWFDPSVKVNPWMVAPADTGDCGDSYETYEEAVKGLEVT